MTSILDDRQYLFTSESVTEGHPDKMCDQISDAILDAILTEDPDARVACETATTTGLVLVLGEISTKTYVDFQAVVRDTHAVLPVSIRCQGEYGVDDLAVGVPAVVGAGGVERVIEVALSDSEQQAFRAAVAELAAARRQVAAGASAR